MVKVSSGTLIIAIPCKVGLVVSADKRMIISVLHTIHDDVTKLYILSSSALFSVTGYPLVYNIIDRDTEHVEILYDARETVKSFYLCRDTASISSTWDELGLHLQNEFNRLLSISSSGKGLPIPRNRGDWLYHLPFWFLTNENNIGTSTIKLKYVREEGLVQYFIEETQQEKFQSAEVFAYGHTDVVNELKTGNDTRFDRYRSDHATIRFLKEPPPPSEVEIEEAKTASVNLIRISSEWIHTIGPTSDSILIHKEKGVLSLD
jgi:hypothetical protein